MLFMDVDPLILKQTEHSMIFTGSDLKILLIFRDKFLSTKLMMNNHIFYPKLIKIILDFKMKICIKI